MEQPHPEGVQLDDRIVVTREQLINLHNAAFGDGYVAAREWYLDPENAALTAAQVGALIVDDPRAFNAWMTQGVVLLKQQAEEAKAARRPRGVIVEDGIEDLQSSGISSESGFAGDGPARWAQKVAERQGMVSRETSSVPEPQYAPRSMPQASYDPNLASLVRAAVQEYMHGVSGTQLASPLPPAGYGYPTQPMPVAPPLPPHRLPNAYPVPGFWYDPRRR